MGKRGNQCVPFQVLVSPRGAIEVYAYTPVAAAAAAVLNNNMQMSRTGNAAAAGHPGCPRWASGYLLLHC